MLSSRYIIFFIDKYFQSLQFLRSFKIYAGMKILMIFKNYVGTYAISEDSQNLCGIQFLSVVEQIEGMQLLRV